MKKTLTFSLLIFLFFTAAAQEKRKFTFGLHVAPSIDWMKPNAQDYSSDGTIIGFTWGAFGELNFTDNYSLVSAIDFRSTGGKLSYPDQESYNGTDFIGTMNRTYHIKYIEVPIALKMSTKDIGKFCIWGKFGIGSAFIIGAKSDDSFTATNGNVTNTNNKDITSYISTFKESLIIGLGTEYRIAGSTKIVAGLIFNNGFTDILSGKNRKDNAISEKAFVNQVELNIGIVF
ncbi:MAG: outer membrane beta-barrel protein [Bacteroidota bacterium]